MINDDYEKGRKEGFVEGELKALRDITSSHDNRIGNIERGMKEVQKVAYILAGVVGFVGIFPQIKAVFS